MGTKLAIATIANTSARRYLRAKASPIAYPSQRNKENLVYEPMITKVQTSGNQNAFRTFFRTSSVQAIVSATKSESVELISIHLPTVGETVRANTTAIAAQGLLKCFPSITIPMTSTKKESAGTTSSQYIPKSATNGIESIG